MRTWKLAVAALALGLVFCGAANAAELTITIEVADLTGTPVDPASLTAPGNYLINVYGTATGDGAGDGFYSPATVSFSIYTPDTVDVTTPNVFFGKVKTSNATVPGYSYINASKDDLSTAISGQAQADVVDPDLDHDAYNATMFSTAPPGTPFTSGLILSQEWATTGDPATLAVYVNPDSAYWNINTGGLTEFQSVVAGASVQIGESVGPGDIPTVADVAEGDWGGPVGWNNHLREVTLSIDPNGNTGATDVLVDPGTGFVSVSSDAIVTIGDLAGVGTLPDYPGASWPMKVSVGGVESEVGSMFIPEPTTIVLVSCGAIALVRRRRRA